MAHEAAGHTMNAARRLDVTAIVVSYNTRDLLLNCVRSLMNTRQVEPLKEIIVVDSGSTDGSANAVRLCFPDARTLETPNRGYGSAVNAGAAIAEGDFLLILNADTEVLPGAISRLRNTLCTEQSAGLAGPRLYFADGSIQSSRRSFPSAMTPFFESTILEEWWPENPWARTYHMRDVPEQPYQTVDWLVGAAFMTRRAVFEQVGGFDPAFRMFSEEVDLAYRLRCHGWRAIFVAGAEVIHLEGASTSQDVPGRQAEFDASRVRLQRRMHGPLAAYCLALALRLGYVVHICREGAKWIIGHRRVLRASRIRLYAGLLMSRWETER